MANELQELLRQAIENNQPDEVERLINQGADANFDDGRPLELATELNHNQVAQVLLNKGAFIHNTDTLQVASGNGNIELMTLYMNHARAIGEPFNWASKGESLAEAATTGEMEAVKFLISRKADINYIDCRPLTQAAANGHLEVVKYLVANGADVRAERNEALRYAKKYKKHFVVEYLENYRPKKHI